MHRSAVIADNDTSPVNQGHKCLQICLSSQTHTLSPSLRLHGLGNREVVRSATDKRPAIRLLQASH